MFSFCSKKVLTFIVLATFNGFLNYKFYTRRDSRIQQLLQSVLVNVNSDMCQSYFKDSLLLNSINESLWRPQNFHSQVNNDRILEQIKWSKFISQGSAVCLKKKRIIVFDTGDSYYGTNNKIQCPDFDMDKFCSLTISSNIRSPYKSVGDFDAAVFTQNYRYQKEVLLPKNVIQFIYLLETPLLSRANLALNNALLASYYRGSDISSPYAKWVPFNNESLYTNTGGKNYAEGKSKLVAIFVSNCNRVNNNRMGYVNELKKYIPIDVYGKCGESANCMKNESRRECMSRTIKQYKFYLSFENANCRDYITEKFYHNALSHDAIPVAMGAHPDDYKAEVPKNSYILVEDFNSPQHLADHLKMLDKNDTLYNEYFKWKGTGKYYDNARKDFFCRVCGMLLYSDFVKPPVWKKNVATWKEINVCLPKDQWYWNKSNI